MGGLHSWQGVSLLHIGENTDAPQPTIADLLYRGEAHLASGEPGEGKTWVAYIVAAEAVLEGGTVVIVDLEMGAAVVLDRFRALGLTDEQIDQQIIYMRPDEPLATTDMRQDVDDMLAARTPALAVIDAMAGALAIHGLDPNAEKDIEKYRVDIQDRFIRGGCAVLALDHVTKDKANRGRFSTGSQRKLGIVAVHLGVETIKPIAKGRTGLIKLQVHKDRHGALTRPIAMELEIASDRDGKITWEFRDHQHTDDHAPASTFRPTTLMEKVSRYLEAQAGPVSRKTIEDNVKGKRDYVRVAMDVLAAEGHAAETHGPRGARLIQIITPYHDIAPPRPDIAPTSPQGEDDDLAPRPLPIRQGRGEVTPDEIDRLLTDHADIATPEPEPTIANLLGQLTKTDHP